MNGPAFRPSVLLIGLFLLLGSGCSQGWKLAPGDGPIRRTAASRVPREQPPTKARLAEDTEPELPAPPPPPSPAAPSPRLIREPIQGRPAVLRLPSLSQVQPSSYESPGPFLGMPSVVDDVVVEDATGTMSDSSWLDSELSCDGTPRPCPSDRFGNYICEVSRDVCDDYAHFYTRRTMVDWAYGLAGGGILANTAMDENFQNWYQNDIRSIGTDRFAAFWKPFGEGQIFIPAFAALAIAGNMCYESPMLETAGGYSERVTRGYLVGAPPLLMMQWMLGASRPGEHNLGSQWKPFDDANSVSGHAFMGSVPFITAAQMVKRPWLKVTLYACSTFTAWSRVNDDDHYLSQSILGWWMGYLACRAVNQTEMMNRHLTFVPVNSPEMTGLAMIYER